MNVFEEVKLFYQQYQGEKRIVGKSEEGREIFAFFVGAHTAPTAICQCAIHAREWITAYIGLAQIARGVSRGGAWVIPLVNPDGALLSQVGIESVAQERTKNRLLRLNGGKDFSLWKANARGVDLNVNFDARWGTGEKNVFRPAPENYIGKRPCSAQESRTLKYVTYSVRPQFTLSYHAKGEEIYWEFHQPFFRKMRDKRLACVLKKTTGYPLKRAKNSAGGYKDWCIGRLKIPAFTVEVGSDGWSHPIGKEYAPLLCKKHENDLNKLLEEY